MRIGLGLKVEIVWISGQGNGNLMRETEKELGASPSGLAQRVQNIEEDVARVEKFNHVPSPQQPPSRRQAPDPAA